MTDDVFDEDADYDPEEAERSIAEFIAKADELEGPSSATLASAALAEVTQAWERVDRLLADQPNNKVIATMLELSRQMRQGAWQPGEAEQWQLSAASTIVSGLIRPGSGETGEAD